MFKKDTPKFFLKVRELKSTLLKYSFNLYKEFGHSPKIKFETNLVTLHFSKKPARKIFESKVFSTAMVFSL